MKYIIIMDVSGDIDMSVPENQELKFIPMEYSLGEEMLVCDKPQSKEQLHRFYEGQRNGDLTKTSQITPYLYEEYISPYMEQGYSVLYLCLSSGLSSTYQSALMAQTTLEEKYPGLKFLPIDTLAATGGMGVLAERALRNKAAGMSLKENYADVEAATHKIKHWFLVQDLMYLKRGGRVSAATAVIGTALNIKPILKINETGHLDTFAKKRGNKSAMNELLKCMEECYDAESGDVVYIINADDEELGAFLKEKVSSVYPDAVIRESVLCPIIGAHTGPGMAAIIHMGR